jgi:hypothetical protein
MGSSRQGTLDLPRRCRRDDNSPLPPPGAGDSEKIDDDDETQKNECTGKVLSGAKHVLARGPNLVAAGEKGESALCITP